MTDPRTAISPSAGADGSSEIASDRLTTELAAGRVPPPPVHSERRRRSMGWRTGDVLRAAASVIAMYIAIRLLWFANALFLTAFLGVLFGLAVSAGVDRLQRFRIPRGAGAALIVLGFFAALFGLGAWMAPTIRSQSRELRQKLPEAVDRIETWMNAHQGGLLGSLLGGGEVPARPSAQATAGADSAAPVGGQARGDSPEGERRAGQSSPGQATPGASAQARSPADEQPGGAATLKDRIAGQLTGVGRYLFPFLSSTVAVFGGLLLIIFFAVYIGADPELYRRGLMHLFPHHSRQRAGEVLSAMATVLRKWLVTQLIAMAAIGAITTMVLLLLRVKAAFALGLLAGLFEFIPTVGPILSAIPAVAMGFLDSPEKALVVALAYVAIQFLENHILIPLLMKGGVDLPPALTIFSQALMALVFGFLGLMVAVPALAATTVAVKLIYVEGVVGDPVSVFEDDDDAEDDG
jgi:predicted PurR-regulated permease PerM